MTESLPCAACGYPVLAPAGIRETVKCPYCGTINEAIGIEIPNTVFVGVVCFLAGVFLGPAFYSFMKGASGWLERQARERIK